MRSDIAALLPEGPGPATPDVEAPLAAFKSRASPALALRDQHSAGRHGASWEKRRRRRERRGGGYEPRFAAREGRPL